MQKGHQSENGWWSFLLMMYHRKLLDFICDKYSLSPIEVDFLSKEVLERNLFRKELSLVKPKDDLIEVLKSLNVSYIDNRPKKGVLWVLGGIEIQSIVNQLGSMGYVFHFKECGGKATKGQSAWWTQ